MFLDKDTVAEIAIIIGLIVSYVFPALLLVRREKEKDFWNIVGIVLCLALCFFMAGLLASATVYFVWFIFAIIFNFFY